MFTGDGVICLLGQGSGEGVKLRLTEAVVGVRSVGGTGLFGGCEGPLPDKACYMYTYRTKMA